MGDAIDRLSTRCVTEPEYAKETDSETGKEVFVCRFFSLRSGPQKASSRTSYERAALLALKYLDREFSNTFHKLVRAHLTGKF